MPPVAYLLAAFFVVLAVVTGAAAWWLVGPRRVIALPLPILAAFGALYLAGHRFAWQIGPMVDVLGFRLALPFDMALAIAAAFMCALVQRPLVAFRERARGA